MIQDLENPLETYSILIEISQTSIGQNQAEIIQTEIATNLVEIIQTPKVVNHSKKTGNIPKHHKLSGGAIVAIVIGCLVIIGGIIGVVIYLASNKDDKEAKNKSNLKKAIDQSVSQYNKLVTQLENSLRCDGSCRNLHRYCCKIRTRQNLIWRNTFTETVVPTEDS